MGEEVKTASFARFPGGGLATTALVAASLGTPTKVITRVGRDALASPEWQKLDQSGISTEDCEFDPRLPTAMTDCAAFGGDRMMLTHDVINLKRTLLGVFRLRADCPARAAGAASGDALVDSSYGSQRQSS
jgi:sugar/nucleoside kinase (ribokinase family)